MKDFEEIRKISVYDLGLPLRTSVAFENVGIKTVEDLMEKSETELHDIQGFGEISLYEVRKALRKLDVSSREEEKEEEISDTMEAFHEKDEDPVIFVGNDLLGTFLARLPDERMSMIIKKRFGLTDGVKHTLEEIGREEGLTRERIRQIQVKAMRRLAYPRSAFRKLMQSRITDWLASRDGVVDETEANKHFLTTEGFDKYDGSSVLDLADEMRLISKAARKGVVVYPIALAGIKPNEILAKAEKVLSDSEDALSIDEIRNRIRLTTETFKYPATPKMQPEVFLKKLFALIPTINKVDGEEGKLYALHSNEKYFPRHRSNVIYKVMKAGEKPLHFTEVAQKVNDLKIVNKELDARNALNILIDDKRFAHTGIRGTYGLTEWGLRRELLPKLIEECMNKAGYPLSMDQIFHYVSKYKYTKKGNINAILSSNRKFCSLRRGLYWLAARRNEFIKRPAEAI